MTRFRISPGVILPALLLALWWGGSHHNLWNAYILPSPQSVLKAAWGLSREGLLVRHITSSLSRVFWGFTAAFITAFPLGVLCGLKPLPEKILSPTFDFIRQIPPIALVPLFILWFGLGETSKIAIIVLTAFFPVFLNTVTAIRSVDPQLIEVGIVYRLTPLQRFYRIALPCILPQVLTGVRLGLSYSWRALIGAELLAASSGIGFLILESEQIGRADRILVGVFLTALLGYLTDRLLSSLTPHRTHQNTLL